MADHRLIKYLSLFARWRSFIAALVLILAVPSVHADDWADCRNSDPGVAIRGCTAIIEADSDTAKNLATAYKNRGYAYFSRGDLDRAVEDYSQVIALCPSASAYYDRAAAYSQKGDFARAIEDSNLSIALDPKYADAYFNRGYAYFSRGDLDRAIEDLSQVIALDPKDAKAYHNRGYVYFSRGDLDRAIWDYGKTIALDPKNARVYYDRGLAYGKKGEFELAIKDHDQSIVLNAKDARNFNGRCWTLAVAGKNLDQARADCDASLALANDPYTLDSRGLVGIKQGRYDLAWKDYDDALKSTPELASALYGRGIAALRLGRDAEGNADLAAAAKLDGKIAETYAGYGVKP